MSAERNVAFHLAYLPRYFFGICSWGLMHVLGSVTATASLDEGLFAREKAGAGDEIISSTARPNHAAAGSRLLGRASVIGTPHPSVAANTGGRCLPPPDGLAPRLSGKPAPPNLLPAELLFEFLKPNRASLLKLADPLLHPRGQRSRPVARRWFRAHASCGLLPQPLALGAFDNLNQIRSDHVGLR